MSLSPEKIAFYVCISVVGLIIIGLILLKGPKRMKQESFKRRWRSLQARCANKSEWSIAIIEADDLLAEALKKKRVKGKTVGERLVEVQRQLTDNDAVWFGHKLRSKIDATPDIKLNKTEVMKALSGIRQALKDIGAIK